MVIDLKFHSWKQHITKAFTLAEVLITLLIIGVISSLVIPALLNDTNDAELKTALKKISSNLIQATMKIQMDNAGTLKGLFNTNEDVRNAYLNHFSYVKSCDSSLTIGNCWPSLQKYKDNTQVNASASAGAVLNDGISIRFKYESNNCTNTSLINANYPICGRMYVDVNGVNKAPNTWGKDLYGFWIMENHIKPMGFPGDTNAESNCTTHGIGCTAQYLMQ